MTKKKDLKTFGLIWAAIFTVIALLPLLKDGEIKFWALGTSFMFIAVSFVAPAHFTSFYKVWIRVGEFVGNTLSKVIMFILYFVLFTAVSFVLKLLRKDPLKRSIDKSAESYWIKREVQPQPMKRQF